MKEKHIYLADETISEEKEIEIAHLIIEETFENSGVESTHENVSPKSNLNEFRGEVILFFDNVDKILEKDTFCCYSCGTEDWFDWDCSYSEYESKSEKKVAKCKEKIVKTSGEIDTNRNTSETEIERMAYPNFANETFVDEIKDFVDETKSGQKEIEEKSKPKNYACNFDGCESLFVTKKGLKRHKKAVHLNLRPFNCSKYSLCFNRKYHLQYHMNSVHLKLKSHECGQCSVAFSRKDSLRKHINDVHLNLKPFKCSHCSKTFNRNSNMKSHFKRIHGK